MGKKFKVFAFCLPLTLSFLVIPLSWGEIDTKKAIIGKWEQYDPKGNETLEFFKDGTISIIFGPEGRRSSVAGDYRFIDDKHVRINLGGLRALVGPVVCKVSVSENNLILTSPDREVIKYWRVGIKPRQIESTADKDEAVRIQEEIKRRLRKLSTTTYTYLLDTDSIGSAISTTWMHLTSPILGNLVEKYNEFYYAALDYQGMAISALRKARLSLTENNIPTAKKYIREADRYVRLANLSNDAAIKIFEGEVDLAAELAEGIYKGSKAAVKFRANIVLGPWACKVLDGLFLATDFAIDTSTESLNEAAKNAIYKAVITVMFDEMSRPR